MSIRHSAVSFVKNLLYGRAGEPYRIAGRTLRYVPGTRPTRLKYRTAENWVARYDALEVAALVAGVKPGHTVLDVGANAGQFGLLSALAGPDGTVICFEPDPAALAQLRRNIALNPKLKPPQVEAVAIAEGEGRCTFYVDEQSSGNSSLAKASFQEKQLRPIEVATRTIDSYLAEKRLSPDWIKIDTEGAEIAILKGATAALASDANFLVELHPYAWDDFGQSFDDLRRLVEASGRRMRYLDRSETLSADPTYGVVALDSVAEPVAGRS